MNQKLGSSTCSGKRRWSDKERQKWVSEFVHPTPSLYRPPIYSPGVLRQLEATNEFGTYRSTWRRSEGIWSCIQADPIVAWMKGISPSAARVELLRMGCVIRWVPISQVHETATTERFQPSDELINQSPCMKTGQEVGRSTKTQPERSGEEIGLGEQPVPLRGPVDSKNTLLAHISD